MLRLSFEGDQLEDIEEEEQINEIKYNKNEVRNIFMVGVVDIVRFLHGKPCCLLHLTWSMV
jgi:hypothetical protein